MQVLTNDGVILCPTDTIWGLSCDAENKTASAEIYRIKRRDLTKPFIVLVDNIERAKDYIDQLHPRIENLMHFYKKPLTIIHKASSQVPDHLLSESKEVAIRVCGHSLIKDIIKELGRPLISTSANIQGAPSPTHYSEVVADILETVDYVCFSEREPKGHHSASSIIKYDADGQLFFLR